MFLLSFQDVKDYLISNTTKIISTAVVIFVALLLVFIARVITKRFIKKNNDNCFC